MSEQQMWQRVRPVLQAAKLDPVRVENKAIPGTPDVNYVEGWIELKDVDRWPPMGGPLRLDHFTQHQRVWLLRRWRAGGHAWLLLRVGREWLLFDGWTASQLLGYSGSIELRTESVMNDLNLVPALLIPWLTDTGLLEYEQVKLRRLRACLTVEDVGERLGVTAAKVRAMERGAEPSDDLWAYFARVEDGR